MYANSLPPGDYYAYVTRRDRRPNVNVYAWSIRRRLPAIRIPLAAPDPDIQSDLAAVFQTAYDRARYTRTLNYSKALSVPLKEEDRPWARQMAGIAGHHS